MMPQQSSATRARETSAFPISTEGPIHAAAGRLDLARQIDLVLMQARRAAAVNLMLGAGVAALFSSELSTVRVVGWYLLLTLACASRWYAASAYLQRSESAPNWLWVHHLAVICTGLIWGLSTFWLGRDAPYLYNVFLTFVLAGNASGAIPLMAPLPTLHRLYLLCAGTPVLIDFLSRSEDLYRLMAFMIGLFCMVLDFTARNYHRALLAALSLDRANAGLVKELGSKNADLQAEISERRRSEARFHSAFYDAPIGLALCNSDGWIVEVNRALCTMSGYQEAELLKLQLTALCQRDDHAEPASKTGTQHESVSAGFPTAQRFLTKNGDARWVSMSASDLAYEADTELYSIVQIQDITKNLEMSHRLSYQARHDDLTGLLNRREFEQRVTSALHSAIGRDVEHAICYLDLDLFKLINDTCGHAAGDQLLRTIAGILRQQVRQTDSIARIGGDEFVLLLECCTVKQAQRTANAIRRAVEDLSFPWGDKRFRVGVSIGLVPVSGQGDTVSDILSAADAACFAAKEQGRNRVHTYHRSDAELSHRQGEMDWVTRIAQALDESRFELMYQSIEPSAGRITHGLHFEFLIRLRDVDGQLIGPGAFLPAAERYHIITRLDRWVVGTACHWLGSLGERASELELCAINLSGQSLTNEDFLHFTLAEVRRLGALAERICFEITETAAIGNLGAAQRYIAELKTLGCKFALDDFGSGLSSFGYLKALPVDYLKIDGLFVKDLASDPVDYAMVRAINEIGKVLGKQTIAEFVENDEIRACLIEIGVDFVQGYGVAMPRPLAEIFAG